MFEECTNKCKIVWTNVCRARISVHLYPSLLTIQHLQELKTCKDTLVATEERLGRLRTESAALKQQMADTVTAAEAVQKKLNP